MSTTKTFPDIAITASIFAIIFSMLYTIVTGSRVLFGTTDLSQFTPNITLLFISFVLYLIAVIFLTIGKVWSTPSLNGVASVVLNVVYFIFGVVPLVYYNIYRVENTGEPITLAFYRLLFVLFPFLLHAYISARFVYINYIADIDPPSSVPTSS